MAIAFNTSGVTYAASASTATVNLTCSGTDRVAIIFLQVSNDTGSRVTSVTVGGSNATFIRKDQLGGAAQEEYSYYYVNPPTSSTAYTVTCADASDDVEIHVLIYTGVDQTTPCPQNTFASGTSTATPTVTTTVDNSWLASVSRNTSNGPSTASTGTTTRNSGSLANSGDSNGAKSPTGSYSMAWTRASGTTYASLVSIAPTTAAATNSNFFALM